MNDFIFSLPTKICFGDRSSRTAGPELSAMGLKKVLVVTDKGIPNAGILQPIEESLRASHVEPVIYDEVLQNSNTEVVHKGFDLFKQENCQALNSSAVTITMKDGKELTAVVDDPKGDKRNPVSQKDVENKFRNLVTPILKDTEVLRK